LRGKNNPSIVWHVLVRKGGVIVSFFLAISFFDFTVSLMMDLCVLVYNAQNRLPFILHPVSQVSDAQKYHPFCISNHDNTNGKMGPYQYIATIAA
jgi:hypothetical protein